MKKSSIDFCLRKWQVIFRLLAGGLGLALAWALWAQFGMAKDYPESFVLGNPSGRYGDFTDETLAAVQRNPYDDPISDYSPAAFVFFRALSYSDNASMILVFFFSLISMALLLSRLLQAIIPSPWAAVSLAFLFLAISYPVLFCLDRGNLEIVMAPLIGWALYYYSRHRDVAGTICLFPAICLKFYPAVLLVLLLRRRKTGLAVLAGIGGVVIAVACSFFFQASPAQIWISYRQNLGFFHDCYILENHSLGGSASLWNTYKIVLIALQDAGVIGPVNFGFDGAFIQVSYLIYSTVFALIALICIGYAWLWERHQTRAILILLLFLSVAAPHGADYRLIYASMALALLAFIPQQRRGDRYALVLIALAVIPKKEILLTFIGETESRYADVPVQALLNPVFILTAMTLLINEASHAFDWRKASLRLGDLRPWNWRWH